jgi:hypothetical protein
LFLAISYLVDVLKTHARKYDLRVVLVHDGLPGRSHLHSYTHLRGKWWKTVDWEVSEVSEEDVLTDPAGLHLGAGAYILMYSRALPDESEDPRLVWPETIMVRSS